MGFLRFGLAAVLLLATFAAPSTAGTKCEKGPCGPGNERCVGGKPQQYVFHLSDETCAINDPNGPFYDEVHGMYHNFYQDHLAEPMAGAGRGPDWGHWVSKDFLHWARLPVAIWNDKWYDDVAIFSGSTTIVDGKPVIIYPGLCTKEKCPTSFTYDAVVPANISDPFLTEWTKPSYNPLVNGTGDDPSTAWQTADGEWRLIGNQGGGSGPPIYGSKDFKSWYKIGFTTLKRGDCPTLFPLPALTPGSGDGLSEAELAALPNRVHKAGSSNDQVQVGTWTDGKPGAEGKGGTPGTWVEIGGSVPLDNGKTHASKDFYDPVKQRRIMWVWGTLPNGIQTIPRDMTYDPRTGKINYAPVEEMKELRSAVPLAALPASPLGPGAPLVLKASVASDVEVVFERPTAPTNLTLDFAGGRLYFEYAGGTTANVGFAPKTLAAHAAVRAADAAKASSADAKAAALTVASGGAVQDNTLGVGRYTAGGDHHTNLTSYMPGVDLPGNDMGSASYPAGGIPGGKDGCQHYPKATDPKVCEALCRAAKGCGAWTYVLRGSPAGSGDCCLKSDGVQSCPKPLATCTSGVLTPTTKCTDSHGGGGGGKGKGMADTVTMLGSDTHISVRLFLDTAVAEAYFMGGRVAMTIPVPVSTADWSVTLGSSSAARLSNATSWGMSSIYVTKEEVLATPRRA